MSTNESITAVVVNYLNTNPVLRFLVSALFYFVGQMRRERNLRSLLTSDDISEIHSRSPAKSRNIDLKILSLMKIEKGTLSHPFACFSQLLLSFFILVPSHSMLHEANRTCPLTLIWPQRFLSPHHRLTENNIKAIQWTFAWILNAERNTLPKREVTGRMRMEEEC